MPKEKVEKTQISDDEVRWIMLQFFYDRNKNATSRIGKKGSAAKISDIRAALKSSHGLKSQDVQSNLTYLLSQKWVEEITISKNFTTKSGVAIPSNTNYYIISAVGMDKISGPSEFTRDRFEGIKIEATGQNIITVGDGNQVNAVFGELSEALGKLRHEITKATPLSESDKLEAVSDIDTIQAQLSKSQPDKTIIERAWDNINRLASVVQLADAAKKIIPIIAAHLTKLH